MDRNFEKEIALLDKLVVGLEKEGKLKDELIAAQKEILTTHEETIKWIYVNTLSTQGYHITYHFTTHWLLF